MSIFWYFDICFHYCRINRITFDFTLATFFRDNIIEDETAVHAMFQVHVTLVNDLYSSMTVNIGLDSSLRRYCKDFRAKTTILDISVILLLIISFISYIISIVNSIILAVVSMHICKQLGISCLSVLSCQSVFFK